MINRMRRVRLCVIGDAYDTECEPSRLPWRIRSISLALLQLSQNTSVPRTTRSDKKNQIMYNENLANISTTHTFHCDVIVATMLCRGALQVSIYRLATNCDEYCFIWTNPWLTEWNTDVTTTICKEEYDKHDKVEVDIVNIDEENNAEVDVTVYICGCSHTFKVKAVLDSNSYGDFSEIKSCSDFGNCQYIYDHQVQIKIESASDDGKGDRCNSAVVYGDKLSLLLTFFLVLAELLLWFKSRFYVHLYLHQENIILDMCQPSYKLCGVSMFFIVHTVRNIVIFTIHNKSL